jgi:hypothetical protein
MLNRHHQGNLHTYQNNLKIGAVVRFLAVCLSGKPFLYTTVSLFSGSILFDEIINC